MWWGCVRECVWGVRNQPFFVQILLAAYHLSVMASCSSWQVVSIRMRQESRAGRSSDEGCVDIKEKNQQNEKKKEVNLSLHRRASSTASPPLDHHVALFDLELRVAQATRLSLSLSSSCSCSGESIAGPGVDAKVIRRYRYHGTMRKHGQGSPYPVVVSWCDS